ncbi:family 43 glycosylhydrolase [Phenylobacterium sp. LjRoot225]|uniref:family 43 glycosylhydrolase n=1 Tax=Phenylobacterium sp. LjRoot225 TaxID=3342285 RepID=UPI003ED06B60
MARATLTKRDLFVAGGAAAACAALPAHAQEKPSPAAAPALRRSFTPGEVWLDTSGKPIQAHAGSILQVGDTYYWYGENKEFTTGKTEVWTWGVRLYSSPDLYNWTDLGLIIQPDTQDRNSPLHPAAGLDRPHILYNSTTKKFVCWIKLLGNNKIQTRAVLTADKITGPYEMAHPRILPVGMSGGDFDLVASPDDGKAYMYFERVHSELICADLTEDYTNLTGYYSTHFPRPGPPSVRESPAYFRRRGKHYLSTSGTSVYFPNPSEIAVADSFHGPFKLLGDLHPTDRSRTSFNTQICSVFRHPKKKDLYIALADRWMGPQSGPEFESGETSRRVQSLLTKVFSSPRQTPTRDEVAAMKLISGKINTSIARYVWLPILFDKNDRPRIEWRTEWSLDEFE